MELFAMTREVGPFGKALITMLAAMGPLIGMDSMAMRRQVVLFTKGLVALRTLVRLDLFVHGTHVLVEMTAL